MNTINMQEWAKKLNLPVGKVESIVKMFGLQAENMLKHILRQRLKDNLEPVYGEHSRSIIDRIEATQYRGKSDQLEMGVKYKASAAPVPQNFAERQPTRTQVITALAKRFNVSEAALKAAVLQSGSIAGAIEAIKAQQTTVDSLIFPAQKRANSMSPGVMWSQPSATARPQPTRDQIRKAFGHDTVESLMFGGESRHRADSPFDPFFGDLEILKKR